MEAEVEESSKVDGGGSGGQGEAVAVDAAVADASVPVGDEPGEGAFDHGSVLAVVVEAGARSPVGSCGSEVLVVVGDVKDLAVDR